MQLQRLKLKCNWCYSDELVERCGNYAVHINNITLQMPSQVSQNSLLSKAITIQGGQLGSRCIIPAEARDFSIHQSVQTGAGGHPAYHSVGTEGKVPRV